MSRFGKAIFNRSIFNKNNNCDDDEENEIIKKAKNTRINTIRSMSVLEIIESIVKITEDRAFTLTGAVSKFLKVLGERLNLTPTQALIMSIFVNKCDDSNIVLRDLANHFDGNNISILKCTNEIDDLIKKGVICRTGERRGNASYRVPQNTLNSLYLNKLPDPPKHTNLDAYEWLDAIEEVMENVRYGNINEEEFCSLIEDLLTNNMHLDCVLKLKDMFSFHRDSREMPELDEIKLFFAISLRAINYQDDYICANDIDDYYKRAELRKLTSELEDGTHKLFALNLIEHVNCHGQVDSSHWKLTDYCKENIFHEFRFKKNINRFNTDLLQHDKIVEKPLFYCHELTKQIDQLKELLDPQKMESILNKLESKGMRRGFACLFYGSPGTGKTETVLQIARMTGRNIMQIDISAIRSKWVGETEENIKRCFDSYRKLAKDENDKTPILFFNEADALFNTRNQNAQTGVDRMENAMQNIILQEMENLEGILIATTNLEGSLDPAFERRFLYKIEFTKPTPQERCHIWKAMLPELSMPDALKLAEQFDFSGGQIENIARKNTINSILTNNDQVDLDSIFESCRHELITEEKKFRIGFCV